jgi:hypothetical protein
MRACPQMTLMTVRAGFYVVSSQADDAGIGDSDGDDDKLHPFSFSLALSHSPFSSRLVQSATLTVL